MLFFKSNSLTEPTVEKTEWTGANKATTFFFPGRGYIEQTSHDPNLVRYLNNLLYPEGVSENYFTNSDLIIIKEPEREEYPTNIAVPNNFYTEVIQPIIKESESAEDSLNFLKVEFSKITLLGYSNGCKLIEEIDKRIQEGLTGTGYTKQECLEICSSLFAISYGAAERLSNSAGTIPHISFSTDTDTYSHYHKNTPSNSRFERHANTSHATEGNNLMIVAHKVNNKIHTVRNEETSPTPLRVDPTADISHKDNLTFISSKDSLGHHPYIYMSIQLQNFLMQIFVHFKPTLQRI